MPLQWVLPSRQVVAVVAIERRRSGCYGTTVFYYFIYFFIFCAIIHHTVRYMIDDRSLSFGKEKDFFSGKKIILVERRVYDCVARGGGE